MRLILILVLGLGASGLYAESIPDKRQVPKYIGQALGTPTEVAVDASNRRLTVVWRETAGATSYKIAVRPKDQLGPAWREYTAPWRERKDESKGTAEGKKGEESEE